MKALVLNEFGDAQQFKLQEIKQPIPGNDQVLLKIRAIGINPVDTKVRNGSNRIAKNMKLPAVIGWDVSGVIVACGEGASTFQKGDEVFGCIGFPGAGGGYAEYALANTEDISKKPANLSFEEAAALPIAGLTAFQAIHDHLNVQKGDKLLLQAAAGGVGHLALQLAKAQDAFVIATASEKNRSFLKTLGADQIINYKKEKFEETAKEVDLVLDAMGGDVLHRSIGCTRKGGKVVCLPSSTKNDPEAIQLAERAGVTLDWIIMYINKEQLKQMAEAIASKKMKIQIDKVFSFEEMSKAHKAIETHSTRGKIVVRGYKKDV